MPFADQTSELIQRVENTLDGWLPPESEAPSSLHKAMRYSIFNGGKRIRPLLCYATAELLEIEPARVDAIAAAIELIHCYSLVHDDLPAMDDDDLRRGQPTVHKAFDEATAILCGDALQSLALAGLAEHTGNAGLVIYLAQASGSRGMAGGQALDLMFESTRPDQAAIEQMFKLKTGALLTAAVMMPALQYRDKQDPVQKPLLEFAESVGLAFQIIDDLLDVEGTSEQLGKPAGSDQALEKASWPILFGIEPARQRAQELVDTAASNLNLLRGNTEPLHWMAERILRRNF